MIDLPDVTTTQALVGIAVAIVSIATDTVQDGLWSYPPVAIPPIVATTFPIGRRRVIAAGLCRPLGFSPDFERPIGTARSTPDRHGRRHVRSVPCR
jgi:hypothetical protein